MKGSSASRLVTICLSTTLIVLGVLAVYEAGRFVATRPTSHPLAASNHQVPDEWPRADTLRVKDAAAMHSIWVEAERHRYMELLKGHSCDTLVVPVQSQHFGFDRATRSLMTAQLASALAIDSDRCVADPYIVSSALGDGMRRFDREDVLSLATSLKASTIVWTYAGHDDHMKMEIFMQVERSTNGASTIYKESSRKIWEALPFADDRPPFTIWQGVLPEALTALGLGTIKAKVLSSSEPPSAFEMSDTPEQMVTAPSAGALDTARRYELLASLGPVSSFRPTERLFEKAWLAASIAPDTLESRRIRARALLHLSYRPAALALLSGDDTAEGRFLRTVLDGNLPEAESAEKEVDRPIQKLIANLELRDLGLQYDYDLFGGRDRTPSPISEAEVRSASWAALLGARSGEFDRWQVEDTLPLKALLDRAFPISGFSIDEVRRGIEAIGSAPKQGELELLATRHVSKLLSQQASRFCCSSFKVQPNELDFLQLVSVRAQSSLEKQVVHEARVQGRLEHALELVDAYGAEFAGHPHFSALRADLLVELQMHNNDDRVAEHIQQAQAAARSAAYWEQNNTIYSWIALVSSGIPSAGSAPFIGAYERDFPPRLHWAKGEDVTRYSSIFPGTDILNSPSRSKRGDQQMFAEIRSRFHGSRDLANYFAFVDASTKGGATPEISTLRSQVDKDPRNWDLRSRLATALVRNADYKGALAVVQSYPGFDSASGENSVGLSNYAAEIASEIFWHGDIDSSKALYEIAAHYENGSDASMLAAERLRLIDADYRGAAAIALARMSRYESAYAFRDYINLLFAHGDSRDAWAAFMQVAGKFEIPEFWFSAIVGKRMEGASPASVSEWLSSDAIRSIRVKGDVPALRFGMMFFLIDRAPFVELPSVLASTEGTPVTTIHANGLDLLKAVSDQNSFTQITRGRFREDKHEGKAGDLVPSPYVLFAPAYMALRRGEYSRAVVDFAKMTNFYAVEGDLLDPEMDVALPYFAFAAANSGDTLKLKAFLDALPESRKQFEFHLAQAYFVGLDHQTDEALKHLRSAFALKPVTAGTNMITDYQYAETCIWLFDETKEARYRDLALAWARSYQRMEPTMAWAYALEARYGDPADKGHLRAVALALYLDRNSFWLSGVGKSDIERAHSWLLKNNPFRSARHTNAI